MTTGIDVYPTNWTLSVSNDNIEWKTIDIKNQPLCDENSIIDYEDYRKFCMKKERFHFTLTSPISEYFYFVKFHMIKNSYFANNNWRDLIKIDGFELNGDFLGSYGKLPTCKNHCASRNSVLLYLFIYLLSK